jgi:pyrroloquinoline quinone biosynthesis protein D
MRSTEPMPSDRAGVAVPLSSRPALAPHARLTFDRARDRHVLLVPESVVVLSRTGAEVIVLCDGRRTVKEIEAELRGRYAGAGDRVGDEARRFLARLAARRWVEIRDG